MQSSTDQTNSTTRSIRLVSYCPVCDMRSKSMHARTLATMGETKLMHIQCHKCQNTFLAYVLVNQVGASSVGILTDLHYEDVMRFQSNKSVSVNDVIAAHEQLAQGAFKMVVERKRKIFMKTSTKRQGKKVAK